MKVLATLATAAAMLAPSVAVAACYDGHDSAQISCAAGQVFDQETRSCVPQTS